MTDVPPDPRDEPYYDPRRRDDRDNGNGGHGWQLVAVGLIALIIGGGAAYLIKDDNGDTEVRTVQRESRTVTVQAAPSATAAVTVTQPPAQTVVKTTTVTVSVPTTETETATEP